MRHALTTAVSFCALAALTGCSGDSDTSSSTPVSSVVTSSTTPLPASSSAISSMASSTTSTTPSSSPAGAMPTTSPSPASSAAASSASPSSSASPARPLHVEISSVQYVNGAYDATVTTRPGASFALASAAPGADAVPADKNAPCTATPTGVRGMLTSYSVHCPGAHIASPLLEVRTASGAAGAKAVVPLAVGTNQ